MADITENRWMLYGAYGYTGKLITQRALECGHQPLLAGRNAEKLEALAKEHDLPYKVFSLDNASVVEEALTDVDLVLHAAGPYTFTAAPMQKACLATGTHYLDITGEISVFEDTFRHDALAKQRDIVMVSGVGFDVVPTDCQALHVKKRLPDADYLLVGLLAGGGGGNSMSASAGTLKSMLEILKNGGLARREGHLVPFPLGVTRKLPLKGKEYIAVAIPWGDLSTAYRSTGIPNITTFLVMPKMTIRVLQIFGWLTPYVLKITPLRRLLQRLIDWRYKDKEATLGGHEGRTFIYMQASNDQGEQVESWLETLEAYHLTAISSVDAVEVVFDRQPRGALAPAELMGVDYIAGVEGSERRDG